jgi:hypothetical protein
VIVVYRRELNAMRYDACGFHLASAFKGRRRVSEYPRIIVLHV